MNTKSGRKEKVYRMAQLNGLIHIYQEEKSMKKLNKVWLGLGALLVFAGCSSVDALEQKTSEPIQEPVYVEDMPSEAMDDPFYGIDDDQRVLVLPDGGMLTGSGIVNVYDEDGNVTESYDLDNDPNSMTVQEAREKLLENQR